MRPPVQAVAARPAPVAPKAGPLLSQELPPTRHLEKRLARHVAPVRPRAFLSSATTSPAESIADPQIRARTYARVVRLGGSSRMCPVDWVVEASAPPSRHPTEEL